MLPSGCASGERGYTLESADGTFDDGGAGSVAPSSAAVDDAAPSSTVESDDGGAQATSPPPDDASASDLDAAALVPPPARPPFDPGEGGVCAGPITAGSLAIVELMIESTSGTGDHGEWVEIASMRDCAMNLGGLGGNCPSGAKVNVFEITSDLWIPARGSLVIADSSNAIVNHGLTGLVIPWSHEPGDVLRNAGATVTLRGNGALVDSVTYPSLKLTPGVSIAFPSDCPPAARSDWGAWQTSTASWFPAFSGTPNAPNDDVHCALPPAAQGDD